MAGSLYRAVFAFAGLMSVLSIVGMALLITVDVICRATGIGSLGFALEAVEYCIFLSAFFSAPWVLQHNSHVTVDFLLRSLPAGAARVCEMIADALGLITAAIILFYVCRVGLASWAENMRVIKSIIFPEWWLFAVAAFCLALVVIEFGLRLRRAFEGGKAPEPLSPF